MLAIDIGNTTIALGVIRKNKVRNLWRLETHLPQRILTKKLRKILFTAKKSFFPLNVVVICSVVPQVLKIVKPIVQRTLGIRPLIVGRDIIVPVKNRYRKPRQVGQDRLVCAYAAMRIYGVPLIVIDLGTAITLDVVSKKKEYLGGIIVPGIRLSAESLFKKAALLPKVRIKTPQEIIGRDTKGSILSGLFYGYGALCAGLMDLISQKMKERPRVVMTGGHAHVMRRFINRKITAVEPELVFKGMHLIFCKHQSEIPDA